MEFVERIFLSVFQSSLTAVIVILVVISISKIFRNHLSIRIKNALWILVLIKLLMPVIPETNINLFNILYGKYENAVQVQSKVNNFAEISTQPQVSEENLNDISSNKVDTKINAKMQDNSNKSLAPYIFEKASLIWIIGVSMLGLTLLIASFNLKRKTKNLKYNIDAEVLTLIKECRSKAHIKSRIPIYVYDGVKSPCTLGIIKPRIFIPKYVLNIKDNNQLSHIFLHELIHYKRKDLIYNFLSIIALLTHWFNPLVWIAIKEMRLYRECSCDACVLELLKEEENTEYGMTLLKISRLHLNKGSYSPMPVFFETKNQIKDRIWMIRDFKKGSYKLTAKAVVACAIAAFVIFTNNLAVKAFNAENLIKTANSIEELKNDIKFEADSNTSEKELAENSDDKNSKNNNDSVNKGWIYDNGKWYYYNEDGVMQKNVIVDGYELDENGVLRDSNKDINKNDEEKKAETSKKENNEVSKSSTVTVSDNITENGINANRNTDENQQLNPSIKSNENVYNYDTHINTNEYKGSSKNWINQGNGWTYIKGNDQKETGWVKDKNDWYHFNKDGIMDKNTIIDGYELGSDGAWVK